jgi:hypothetical protein
MTRNAIGILGESLCGEFANWASENLADRPFLPYVSDRERPETQEQRDC